jgi:HlyD family secretion protein
MQGSAGDTPQAGSAGMGGDERRAMRQKMQAMIEKTLQPLMSDEQRPLFEKWKQGRQQARMVPVYVVGADGQPERRMVRAGIADDQFTEVLGGKLREGDQIITRAREVK